MLCRLCDSNVEAFPHLEVDAPFLPELSVKSEGAVGLIRSVVISKRVDVVPGMIRQGGV